AEIGPLNGAGALQASAVNEERPTELRIFWGGRGIWTDKARTASPASDGGDGQRVTHRTGADEQALRATWDPFIHTHHYQVHSSFCDSYVGTHPRRTGETCTPSYPGSCNPYPPADLTGRL